MGHRNSSNALDIPGRSVIVAEVPAGMIFIPQPSPD